MIFPVSHPHSLLVNLADKMFLLTWLCRLQVIVLVLQDDVFTYFDFFLKGGYRTSKHQGRAWQERDLPLYIQGASSIIRRSS